jgi:hypothetical protein
MNNRELLNIIEEMGLNGGPKIGEIAAKAGLNRSHLSTFINLRQEKQVSPAMLRKLIKAYPKHFPETNKNNTDNSGGVASSPTEKQAILINNDLFKQIIAEKEARRQEAIELAKKMEAHYNDARADRVELVADKNKLYSVLESMQKTIDVSLAKANQYLGAIVRVMKADDAVTHDSLDRLEGHPEGTNRKQSGRIQKAAKVIQNQKGKHQIKGK